MVPLVQLWLPIVLSAIGVFIASSLIHTVLKWHDSDYFKLSNEEEVRAAIRRGAPGPGQYVIPHCKHGPDQRSPETIAKFTEGPVAMLLMRANGMPSLPKMLGAWLVQCLVFALFAGYVAAATLAPGSSGAAVFRIVGTVAFLAFAGGAPTNAIWFGLPWRAALKDIVDGLIYGLICGGVFAWLWPH